MFFPPYVPSSDLFRHVIDEMEKYGYYESIPPIYMNLVNVEMEDNPEEARQLLEKALEIAQKYSPERVFDIETRKTLSYFNTGVRGKIKICYGNKH